MIVKLGYEPKTEEEKAEFDKALAKYVDFLNRLGIKVTEKDVSAVGFSLARIQSEIDRIGRENTGIPCPWNKEQCK